MNKYYGDLHIHIGYNEEGLPVKITGSKDLNIANIAQESLSRKGLNIIGIVDCASPRVINDIKRVIQEKKFEEVLNGGIKYNDNLLVILGSEIEIPCNNGAYHVIVYLPSLDRMEKFSYILSCYVKNINLSSQRANIKIEKLISIVKELSGIVVPAHIFTPFKGIYGNCTGSIKRMVGEDIFNEILAVELGLSGDTFLASLIEELDDKAFLSNSDAHSLGKIGREYNLFRLVDLSYESLVKSLRNINGNRILANYGLNPKLGKYHRTYCINCKRWLEGPPPQRYCSVSREHEIIMGVLDRIYEIKDREKPNTNTHPPYYHQVPLEFIPGIGKKTINKMLNKFGTEMNILNNASYKELKEVVNDSIAQNIINGRSGRLEIEVGGGGKYGKIKH